MKISLHPTSEQEAVFELAMELSGETLEQIAIDGAYWRATDIIRTSRISTTAHEKRGTFRVCGKCRKNNSSDHTAQCKICKKSTSRIYFEKIKISRFEGCHYKIGSGRAGNRADG